MNFETISKKMKQFSKDTVTEIQKLNEVRQLNAGIHDEKKQLEVIYAAMGKKLWQQYKEAPLEGFEDEMRTIEEKYSKIDLLQDQIRRVKGVVLCPCCNTEMAATERFCSNCGSKMPEVISIPEEEAETLEGEVVEAKTASVENGSSETEEVQETVAENDSSEAATEKEYTFEDNSSEAETAKEDAAEDNSGNVTVEMTEGEAMTDEKASCEDDRNTACGRELDSQREESGTEK